MSELMPIPFAILASRLFRELEQKQAAYDVPVARFIQRADVDLSCSVHGHRASTPFGSATEPHIQLVQNIVLSWLTGGRVIDLKLAQSLEQYVRQICLTEADAEQSNGLSIA